MGVFGSRWAPLRAVGTRSGEVIGRSVGNRSGNGKVVCFATIDLRLPLLLQGSDRFVVLHCRIDVKSAIQHRPVSDGTIRTMTQQRRLALGLGVGVGSVSSCSI